MSPSELSSFCGGGKLTRIECSTVAGIPDIYTGELLTCSVDRGLDCLIIDNIPLPCSDYKVRYSCNCSGKRDSTTSSSQPPLCLTLFILMDLPKLAVWASPLFCFKGS